MSDTAQGGYLALAVQTAKGTPAVPTQGMRVTSMGVSGTTETLTPDPEIGGGRDTDASAAALAGFKVEGDVEAYLRSTAFGMLLQGAGFVAAAPVQEGATGAWSHVFTPGAAKYLTLETAVGANRAIRRVSDVLVNELTLSVSAGEYASLSASLLGLGEVWQASPIVPTYETDPIATWLGSAITLDGIGTYRFTELEFKIANNLTDDEWQIGSRFLGDVTPKRREVTFSGTIRLGDNAPSVTDLYRAAVYGSKTATTPGSSDPYHCAAAITFGSPKFIGTSAINRFGLGVAMPDVVLSGFPLEGSGDDVVEVSVEGTAYLAGGPVATLTLKNGKSTAY